MDEPPLPPSNWHQADALDLQTIQTIIQIVAEFYMLTSRFPTAHEVRASLRGH